MQDGLHELKQQNDDRYRKERKGDVPDLERRGQERHHRFRQLIRRRGWLSRHRHKALLSKHHSGRGGRRRLPTDELAGGARSAVASRRDSGGLGPCEPDCGVAAQPIRHASPARLAGEVGQHVRPWQAARPSCSAGPAPSP